MNCCFCVARKIVVLTWWVNLVGAVSLSIRVTQLLISLDMILCNSFFRDVLVPT